jgi:murein DD-endopeptidase MepM/ murein hydrolase activator NlpD
VITLTQNVPLQRKPIPTKGITSYLFKRSDTHYHQGLDFGASFGTPVRSVTDGIVSDASRSLAEHFSGYGRIVQVEFIDPPKLPVWILYAHLNDVSVKPGDSIKKGQIIGSVGNTCYSRKNPEKLCRGAHLHFEVRTRRYLPKDGGRLDPVQFLGEYGEIEPEVIIEIKRQEQESELTAKTITSMIVFVIIAGILYYLVKQ